jgi:phosphate acetyltransferase/phosphate butyryltransferase
MSETLLNPPPLSPDAGVRAALDPLFQRCAKLAPVRTGVVWPCSADALRGALEAAEAGLIVPVLYGPGDTLGQLAADEGLDLSACELVAALEAEQAARLAALDAGRGQTGALMKGSLHSDAYLHAVLAREAGLLCGALLSHCALGLIPGFARPLLLSDAALNIAPDTEQKRHICQNAIGLAHALGNPAPRWRCWRRSRP